MDRHRLIIWNMKKITLLNPIAVPSNALSSLAYT